MKSVEEIKAEFSRQYDHGLTVMRDTQQRLGGWLLAGNAAAMLLCLNAVIDGKVGNTSAVKWFVAIFALGVIASFFAQFVSAYAMQERIPIQEKLTLQVYDRHRAEMVHAEKMEKRLLTDDDRSAFKQQMEELDRVIEHNFRLLTKERRLETAGVALFVLSAAALAGAAGYGVFGAGLAGALCTAPP